MVTQTHLNVTLYVNRLSCFLSFQGALIPSSMITSSFATWWHTVTKGRGIEGETDEWSG